MNKNDRRNPIRAVSATKRCPECFANLPFDAVECTECHQKVGEAGKDGLAKKPVNWKAYFSALIACLALITYIWWVFLR